MIVDVEKNRNFVGFGVFVVEELVVDLKNNKGEIKKKRGGQLGGTKDESLTLENLSDMNAKATF